MWSWVSAIAVTVVVGLGVALVVWVVRSHRQDRRRARVLAQLAAQCREQARALPAGEPKPTEKPPSRTVTVEELVARIEGEGLAVRLRWEEGDDGEGPDVGGWPTGVLPRVEPDK